MDSKILYFIDDAQTEECPSVSRSKTSGGEGKNNNMASPLLSNHRCCCFDDPALSAVGRRQARMTALSLSKRLADDVEAVACIYSAPTLASLQTAAEFAAVLDVPIQPVYGLGAANLCSHDEGHAPAYIPYDGMAHAVNPEGAIEVLRPIDSPAAAFDSTCVRIAEYFVSSHGIVVANRDEVKQSSDACAVLKTAFHPEVGFIAQELYHAHWLF